MKKPALGRKGASVALLSAGVAAAAAGSYLAWGPGTALLVLSGLLIAIALLLGWE